MPSKGDTARFWAFGTTMVVASQLAALGCAGSEQSGVEGQETSSSGGQETGAMGGPTGSTDTPESSTGQETAGTPDGVPAVDEPSPAYIRRLTHREYDNTIAHLFPALGLKLEPTFEADLAQDGFTNNAAAQNVSPTLTEQYVVAAETVSEAVVKDLDGLLACDAALLEESACVQAFIDDFGSHAWRRPLEESEKTKAFKLFSDVRAEAELDIAVRALIEYFLIAPHFIYLLEPIPAGGQPGAVAPLTAWELATRLSYFLLGSMPDDALFAAAASGELATAEGVAAQARRLLALDAARERIGLFYEEWLRLRNIDRLKKDPVMFPDFDLSIGPLMRDQVKLFAQSIILDQNGSAKDLLTSSSTFLSPELAPYYGTSVAGEAGAFLQESVALDPSQRAGLLTHVAVLATLAHNNQTDPVHRGKFVRNGILCEDVLPPPPGVVISIPEVEPGTSTRERFRIHQENPVCRKCHEFMDPIGLGFENYDAVGQWRIEDAGQPIDASGEVVGTDVEGTFNGAVELANQLAESDQVMECMTRTWLRFALGRSETAGDEGAIQAAGAEFESSGYVMKELLVALTRTNTFRQHRVLDPNVSAFDKEMP